MPEAVLAPGARIECRSAEWLVRSLGRSSQNKRIWGTVTGEQTSSGLTFTNRSAADGAQIIRLCQWIKCEEKTKPISA